MISYTLKQLFLNRAGHTPTTTISACPCQDLVLNASDFHQRATEAVEKYKECLRYRTYRAGMYDVSTILA